MTIETARHIALRIWRDPEYSHVEMDVVVGEAIAHMLLWLASSRPNPRVRVAGRTKFETSSVDLATDPRWKTRDTQPEVPVDRIDVNVGNPGIVSTLIADMDVPVDDPAESSQMRMTDKELLSVKRAGEVAYKDRAARDRVSVIYQSAMIMAGERAIESEARRRMAQEILHEVHGKTLLEMVLMIELRTRES